MLSIRRLPSQHHLLQSLASRRSNRILGFHIVNAHPIERFFSHQMCTQRHTPHHSDPPGKKEEEQEQEQHMDRGKSTYDAEEVKKFSLIAKQWWNPYGPFKPLHMMNPIRMNFIRQCLCEHFALDARTTEPLKGLKLMDVGCGGGIASESLARLGAQVLGVDASSKNIATARAHLGSQPQKIRDRVSYMHITPEQLIDDPEFAKENYKGSLDAVIAMEVVEHVANVFHFVESCASLLKPNHGAMMLSTLNRTPRSYVEGIIGAEYLLNLVPTGTHNWTRFITPEELTLLLPKYLEVKAATGISFNPLTEHFSLTPDLGVNYMMFATPSNASNQEEEEEEEDRHAQRD